MQTTIINSLTPENNLSVYNFYAVSEWKDEIYSCSSLIFQYQNQNVSIPLFLDKTDKKTGFFRALWLNNEIIGADFSVVGSWEIQRNPNATVLKIKDNGIPFFPNATTFLPLSDNGDGTFIIGINYSANLMGSANKIDAYQPLFYQPQNIISNDKNFNSTYVPFIASVQEW
jgi:hypothetical protein